MKIETLKHPPRPHYSAKADAKAPLFGAPEFQRGFPLRQDFEPRSCRSPIVGTVGSKSKDRSLLCEYMKESYIGDANI